MSGTLRFLFWNRAFTRIQKPILRIQVLKIEHTSFLAFGCSHAGWPWSIGDQLQVEMRSPIPLMALSPSSFQTSSCWGFASGCERGWAGDEGGGFNKCLLSVVLNSPSSLEYGNYSFWPEHFVQRACFNAVGIGVLLPCFEQGFEFRSHDPGLAYWYRRLKYSSDSSR